MSRKVTFEEWKAGVPFSRAEQLSQLYPLYPIPRSIFARPPMLPSLGSINEFMPMRDASFIIDANNNIAYPEPMSQSEGTEYHIKCLALGAKEIRQLDIEGQRALSLRLGCLLDELELLFKRPLDKDGNPIRLTMEEVLESSVNALLNHPRLSCLPLRPAYFGSIYCEPLDDHSILSGEHHAKIWSPNYKPLRFRVQADDDDDEQASSSLSIVDRLMGDISING